MSRSAGAISLIVLAFAGCGSEPSSAGKFQGEQQAVAEVVEDIQRAAERGEAAKLCRDLIARALREKIASGGINCDKEMEKAVEDADAFELEVQKVTVSGTTAQVTVRGEAGDNDATRTFGMVKEDGLWRAASFGT